MRILYEVFNFIVVNRNLNSFCKIDDVNMLKEMFLGVILFFIFFVVIEIC